MEFRAASPADVDRIVTIVNAAYRGTGGANGWTTEAHLVEGARAERNELLTMMTAPGARFELALADDAAILGSVFLRREAGDVCYLGMLSVDPLRQAAGVGKALLERSESLARSWGCRRISMTVLESRVELHGYYARRGYRPTGRSEAFPVTGRSRLKVPGLRLLELEKALE